MRNRGELWSVRMIPRKGDLRRNNNPTVWEPRNPVRVVSSGIEALQKAIISAIRLR
jgi:hypothetical protein